MFFLYRLLLRCYLLFFFFKQKPAYEMRISDWSSDVCSSDLFAAFQETEHPVELAPAEFRRGLALLEPLGDREAVPGSEGCNRVALLLERRAMLALLHRRDTDVCKVSLPFASGDTPASTPSISEEPRLGKECVCKCRFRL